MSAISRQLRDWCRRRNFRLCRDFVRSLDDALLDETDLGPETLLATCRDLSTGFFRESGLDREAVAQELSGELEMPAVRVRLVKVTPDAPEEESPVAGEEEPPDAFISYFHEDADFVSRLAAVLAKRGFTVWYDQRSLTAGASWPWEIERALECTRYVALVATSDSVERPWVRREMDGAYVREGEERRQILVPLRIDDSDLPLFVRARQWCDFRPGFEDGVEDLTHALRTERLPFPGND